MPVKLRLRRQGRRKSPHYAIVAADSRMPRDGRYIEKIGFYDSVAEPAKVYVDHEAALKWLGQGAQPTNTVRSLLRHTGVTVKFALSKQGKSEEDAERIFTRWWEAKKAKKKKIMVSVDIHGNPLEELPEAPKPAKPEPKVAEAAPEAAPEEVAEEETPVAVAAEESAAPEAEAPAAEAEEKEAAPEAEEVKEEVAPEVEEIKAEAAPEAAEVKEEAAPEAEETKAEAAPEAEEVKEEAAPEAEEQPAETAAPEEEKEEEKKAE